MHQAFLRVGLRKLLHHPLCTHLILKAVYLCVSSPQTHKYTRRALMKYVRIEKPRDIYSKISQSGVVTADNCKMPHEVLS
jgi:hypothetical protein